MLQDLGVEQGRPRHPLHADDSRGGVRHAGLRAHRRDPFGGVRRIRRAGTRHPDRGCDAEGRSCPPPAASSRAAWLPTSLCSTRRSASPRTSRRPAWSSSGRMARRASAKAATMTGRADRRRQGARRRLLACRSPPPTRSTSSTPRARPDGRKASCAIPAAIWSR